METCMLGVQVERACNLKLQNDDSYPSLYVVLTFDRQQFRTTIKEKDRNPVWNEHFQFNVLDPSNPTKLEASLHRDEKLHQNCDGSIGMVRIDVTPRVPFADAGFKCYFLNRGTSIRTRGELHLKLYIPDKASTSASEPLLGMDSLIASLSNRLERTVHDQGSTPRGVSLLCLKHITDNFSVERIIGNGGFGVVYKGVLENGEMIAVKKIKPSLEAGMQKQFESEVYHLMMLKHPNIVRCVGYCYEIRHECLWCDGKYVFAEMVERLLCLEYFHKGSLYEYLSDESCGFNWSTRYKIVEGICYGLCHLHGQNDKPIIHLDLKPKNILLDDNMIPKIADFGLSRLLDQQQTIQTSSLGTFGYMAPEFVERGKITPKSDIFSLGVIIIEIITGRRDYPAVITTTSSDDFVELVLRKWKNRLLRSQRSGNLEIDCQQIKRCVQIGLICLNPDRTKRPPARNIIKMLHGSESIV